MQDPFASARCWLTVALMSGLAAAPAEAADARWQERDGDRYEGIRPDNIRGSDFKLLGVHVEPSPTTKGASSMYVSVPLREATDLRIQVWEPESGYAMVPSRERFLPGKPFKWTRAAVLGPESIEADQLFVLATNLLSTLYYPARLTTTTPPAEVKVYVFRFRSGGGVDLKVTIAREEEGRLVEEVHGTHRVERYGGILDFHWDGRGPGGAGTSAGVYHLKLEGTLFLTSQRSIDVDVPFVHHGETAP